MTSPTFMRKDFMPSAFCRLIIIIEQGYPGQKSSPFRAFGIKRNQCPWAVVQHKYRRFYQSAACAADNRAIGTRNGEQLT
jgi:hypothetical protein